MIYWALFSADPVWLEGNAEDFLSAQELERLAGMRFPKRRREWLLGRYTAKRLFLRCLPETGMLTMHEFSVQNQPGGMPFFARADGQPLPWPLSISHRDQWAFCALSTQAGVQIGVDIEYIEPRQDAFLSDYFTEEEQSYARKLDESERVVWMTAAWSMKEAVLKALGTGLRVDTRHVALDFSGTFDAQPVDWSALAVQTHNLGAVHFNVCWMRRGGHVLSMASSEEGEQENREVKIENSD